MNLHNEQYDTELNCDIEKLRNGLFNLATIRFGKIPEIMIKKLFNYEYPNGTTAYDLVSSNESGKEYIEVKFSCVREKEKNDINENNALAICIDNAQANVNRKVKASECTTTDFECNIQQIKPNNFSKLYYGLFFEDQIAVFMITSSMMRECFTLKSFKKYDSILKNIKKCLDEVQPRIQSNGYRDIIYVKNRIEGGKKGSIPELIDNAEEELKKIAKNNDAKNIIQVHSLLTELDDVKIVLMDKNIEIEQKFDSVMKLYSNGIDATEKNIIPKLSAKQHRGNEGEGQFHISNCNIEWHLNSDYFLGWLSYKDLYILLSK